MILYKYVSFDSGSRILETSSIGFTRPEFFNDPFDQPAYPYERSEDPADNIVGRLRVMGKNHIWRENTGILSLTRTATNPLMWAHYAQNHTGLVIGIDAVEAGLTDERSNLIPAQYGSVIYVSRRPSQPFIEKPQTGLAVGATHHFPRDHYEKLQRLFLHKALYWSYEEEVRVVKCIKGISADSPNTDSGQFSVSDGRFFYRLPRGSIKEMYFGFRSDHGAAETLYDQARRSHTALSIYECKLDSGALSVGYHKYVSIAEAVRA
jgi:hypothetical protein